MKTPCPDQCSSNRPAPGSHPPERPLASPSQVRPARLVLVRKSQPWWNGLPLAALIASLLLSACAIPTAREDGGATIRGTRGSDRVESRRVITRYLFPLHPDGYLHKGAEVAIEYWLGTPQDSTRLSHLDDHFSDERYLDEFLGVADSKYWVAFRMENIKYATVDLKVFVFDDQRIVHTILVPGAIRTSRSNNYYAIGTYSVTPTSDNAQLHINTATGVMTYDVRRNSLKPVSATGI